MFNPEKQIYQGRPSNLFVIEAKKSAQAGNLQEAAEICRRGLIYFPANLNGYITLSQIYIAMKNRDRALNVLIDGYKRTGSRELMSLYKQIENSGKPKPVVNNALSPNNLKVENAKAINVEKENFIATDLNGNIRKKANSNQIEKLNQRENSNSLINPDLDTKETIINISDSNQAKVDINSNIEIQIIRNSGQELTSRVGMNDSNIDSFKVGKDIDDDEEVKLEKLVNKEIFVDKINLRDDKINLKLHTSEISSRLKSSNIRLIPGLEFAPLRYANKFENDKNELHKSEKNKYDNVEQKNKQSIANLITNESENNISQIINESNIFTEENDSIIIDEKNKINSTELKGSYYENLLNITKEEADEEYEKMLNSENSNRKLSPLEELAKRLENARIPMETEDVGVLSPAFEPIIITETWADILANQGAYKEALKAYQTLARSKPELFEHFKNKIEDMKSKLIESQVQNTLS